MGFNRVFNLGFTPWVYNCVMNPVKINSIKPKLNPSFKPIGEIQVDTQAAVFNFRP